MKKQLRAEFSNEQYSITSSSESGRISIKYKFSQRAKEPPQILLTCFGTTKLLILNEKKEFLSIIYNSESGEISIRLIVSGNAPSPITLTCLGIRILSNLSEKNANESIISSFESIGISTFVKF